MNIEINTEMGTISSKEIFYAEHLMESGALFQGLQCNYTEEHPCYAEIKEQCQNIMKCIALIEVLNYKPEGI